MPEPTADDVYLRTAKVRARYDNCSHMWIERRLEDDPDFPRPTYIANQRFWRLSELVEWERKKARSCTRSKTMECAA